MKNFNVIAGGQFQVSIFRIIMEQLLHSNLVIWHPQAWLLRMQVTISRQDRISIYHSSTYHNSTLHNITLHNNTYHNGLLYCSKCHLLHILKHESRSVLWVSIRQDSLQMKRLEIQIKLDNKHTPIFIHFWYFINQFFWKNFVFSQRTSFELLHTNILLFVVNDLYIYIKFNFVFSFTFINSVKSIHTHIDQQGDSFRLQYFMLKGSFFVVGMFFVESLQVHIDLLFFFVVRIKIVLITFWC